MGAGALPSWGVGRGYQLRSGGCWRGRPRHSVGQIQTLATPAGETRFLSPASVFPTGVLGPVAVVAAIAAAAVDDGMDRATPSSEGPDFGCGSSSPVSMLARIMHQA